MTKKQQISELRQMVNRSLAGFKGKDDTTKKVNRLLSLSYLNLCAAYNVAHGWKIKNAHP